MFENQKCWIKVLWFDCFLQKIHPYIQINLAREGLNLHEYNDYICIFSHKFIISVLKNFHKLRDAVWIWLVLVSLKP